MFDIRVLRILDFDRDPEGQMALGDREQAFSDFATGCFPATFAQNTFLTNYGFGVVDGIPAVVPFNLARTADCLAAGFPLSPTSTQLEEYGHYPILAGSAVFLGPDHDLCEDIDFVFYMEVGDDPEVRKRIAEKLVEVVKQSQPYLVETSVRGKNNPGKWPAVGKDIPLLIQRDILRANILDTHEAIGNLGYVHFAWPAGAVTPGKPVSLRVHILHSNVKNTDIHPYQEIHCCEAPEFFHRNKHWLSESFGSYLDFLRYEITESSIELNPIKATKRAIPLAGMVGAFDAQFDLLDLLRVYAESGTDLTKRSRILEKIKKSVYNLFIDVNIAMTSLES